jgi:hypothetical protein
VCASTELARAGLEEVLAPTGGLHDVITARTTAEFVPRCGNEGPVVALLEVEATGTSTRDAITDLSQMPPPVRLIGMCTRRQSARHAGGPRRLEIPKESSGREGDVLAHGYTRPTATEIADRLRAMPKASEYHRHRICFELGCQSKSDPVPVRQSRPDLTSSA